MASKTLWVLGNYSRFVRPGHKRIALTGADSLDGLMGTAYLSEDSEELVIVYINYAPTPSEVRNKWGALAEFTKGLATPYTTDETRHLHREIPFVAADTYVVPARSVTILVLSGCRADGQPDHDNDGAVGCQDLCPYDAQKQTPGICGCGVSDADSDSDGTPDCNDVCPNDALHEDSGAHNVMDCNEECPNDPNKQEAGVCGRNTPDVDSDTDGVADCNDICPTDPKKTTTDDCGGNVADVDLDGDGRSDCAPDTPSTPEEPGKRKGLLGCHSSGTVTPMLIGLFLLSCVLRRRQPLIRR